MRSLKSLTQLFKFSSSSTGSWAKQPKAALFSAKKYDISFFKEQNEQLPENQRISIDYFEEELNEKTAQFTKGYDTIIPFVNDRLSKETIQILAKNGVDLVALRCAGFNNTDLLAAKENNIKVVRVPAYSPNAVAEHTMALLLSLVRKIHRAHNRTKEGNFSLDGLLGFDLYKKKVGVIGAGKIGQCFMSICNGFGMEIMYSDPYPKEEYAQKYNAKHVDLETIFRESDVISMHCPLTPDSQYLINQNTLSKMKKGAIIMNTGRGKLMNTHDVIQSLKKGHLGGVGLDVYEHEENFFFKDVSSDIMTDDELALMLMYPNVIVTGHQAFFTAEAITAICKITLDNIIQVKQGKTCQNTINI